MSYSRVQSYTASDFGGGPNSWTPSSGVGFATPITSGNSGMGVVTFTALVQETVAVVDDKGNNWNVSTSLYDAANSRQSCAVWLNDITNGPSILTVNVGGGGGGNWTCLVDEFSGVNTSSSNQSDGNTQNAQASPGTATDAITSGSITPTTNGDLIWGGYVDTAGSGLATHGTGFTAGGFGAPLVAVVSEFLTQSTAASIAATFTQAVNNAAASFIIAFKPPGGGAPARTPTLTLMGVG